MSNYAMRRWSVHHAKGLNTLYTLIERALVKAHPLLKKIGYHRLEKPFFAVERVVKGILLDSQSCGQCVVGATGMSCPMNCPKSLRNGPCGGVRGNGKCEVIPDMDCVWVLAWEGNKRLQGDEYPIQSVQPAVDNRLRGTSAWLRETQTQVRLRFVNEGYRDEI